MLSFDKTPVNRVKRVPDRGKYDRESVYSIIDEALICHVAFVQDGRPFIIPTLHAREGDAILLHGATTSRLMQHIAAGSEVAISMTLVDGLVLARSVSHHSTNYRSAVVFGRGELVPDEEKMAALALLTERLLPGRWEDARQPNEKELKATAVVRVPISLASAKVRTGPPGDDDEDLALPVWAGVIPTYTMYMPPEPAPNLAAGTPVPDYLSRYIAERNARS
jgi:nitroimidazol reductase NimA-like FMN-containing flavoprotein (pyridoxamine 5'-phosphate oxidase superfamily)